MLRKLYCEECGDTIEGLNYYGDCICECCEEYCEVCGDYCYMESVDGMCEDCYEDYLEDIKEEVGSMCDE